MTTHVVISAQLAQTVLTYLSTQPYANVFRMIEELKQAQPIEAEPAEQPVPKLVKGDVPAG